MLAEVSRSVRQYGRSEVTLGGKEAAILSRHLLDLVATLWRRWNTEPPRQAPVVVVPDLSNGEFSASDYTGSIAAGEHSSSDIAVALSEIPSARTDGLLVLLDVCKRKDDGAVFKLHFQRDVRDRLEDATCNFCGVLFTVQKLPRSTWSILLALQTECDALLVLLGGCDLLLSYRESTSESLKQLLGYPSTIESHQLVRPLWCTTEASK